MKAAFNRAHEHPDKEIEAVATVILPRAGQ